MTDASTRTPDLASLAWESLKIGCLGFGGPAGQIALMHRVFVQEKRWIDEPRYLHALSYCMLLPGPEAQQLATYVGWLLHGVHGGVVAGALFVLPGALVMLALSWLYVLHSQTPPVAALFYIVKAAVVALVADAALRIGRRALKHWSDGLIAAGAFLALSVFGAPFPGVIASAAILGLLRPSPPQSAPQSASLAPRVAAALTAALTWGGLWLAPVGLVLLTLGREHLLGDIASLFSQLSVVSFGGAYAVLAYLQQQAVETYGWLSAGQMIDGLGLAETTPGPLILVNQFVAFIAGWHAGGLGLAAAAAALASWCTFAPSFLWIFAGAPFSEALRQNRRAAGALRAITAAVLGVVASLATWFALHVLFREHTAVAGPLGRALVVPVLASTDLPALLVAVAALLALRTLRASKTPKS